MSSVTRFLKQIPSDTQYFVSLTSSVLLQVFYADAAASTTSYVSGAAAGFFSTSTVSVTQLGLLASSTLTIFRDMGKTVVSSGRTFRRLQLLNLDQTGTTGWTSTTSGTAGVWRAGVEGVNGGPVPAGSLADSSFQNFYFETGARGLGVATGLIRYG